MSVNFLKIPKCVLINNCGKCHIKLKSLCVLFSLQILYSNPGFTMPPLCKKYLFIWLYWVLVVACVHVGSQFPNQGPNPSPLHYKADSQPLDPQGSPWAPFCHGIYISLEKAMATHSRILVWKIPWAEEPGRLQSRGLRRVRHDLVTSLSLFTFMHWRRKWQPTPVFLPGESQGWRSLVGCHLWGRAGLDTTEATQLASLHQLGFPCGSVVQNTPTKQEIWV